MVDLFIQIIIAVVLVLIGFWLIDLILAAFAASVAVPAAIGLLLKALLVLAALAYFLRGRTRFPV